MSQLLDQAVAEARKLSDAEQDAIASIILEEIEDDRRWEESLARLPSKLAALVASQSRGISAGRQLLDNWGLTNWELYRHR